MRRSLCLRGVLYVGLRPKKCWNSTLFWTVGTLIAHYFQTLCSLLSVNKHTWTCPVYSLCQAPYNEVNFHPYAISVNYCSNQLPERISQSPVVKSTVTQFTINYCLRICIREKLQITVEKHTPKIRIKQKNILLKTGSLCDNFVMTAKQKMNKNLPRFNISHTSA